MVGVIVGLGVALGVGVGGGKRICTQLAFSDVSTKTSEIQQLEAVFGMLTRHHLLNSSWFWPFISNTVPAIKPVTTS